MKFNKIKIIIFGFFILGIINIPNIIHAETQIELQEGEIIVNLNPYNPQPYQEVVVSINSYATDLNRATITWQEDSKNKVTGIGKINYSFTAGGPNTTTNLSIVVKPADSTNLITKNISISPNEIEIMWESLDGYAPPFYKGRTLPISGGYIKAVAIPNTNTIKSGIGSIAYSWKNNDNVDLTASGYNKNSYIFKNDVFDGLNNITVIASSINGKYNAENTLQIPSYQPKIIFYKKSPSEGIFYNTALNKETLMTEDEMTIVASPYFLPTRGNRVYFNYDWSINGKPIDTPSKKTELTIRPSSRGGYANISLVIENMNELFQKISNNLKLTF